MLKRITLAVGLLTLTGIVAFAQNEDRGNFSAGLETNSTYYFNDKKTNSYFPDGRMGSNNYLKLDYSWKGFYAGLQMEGYFPPVAGYFPNNIMSDNFLRYDIYAGYSANGWDVRIGSIHEQFGNGLLFRTYEDRTLGVNNAIQGVKVGYTFGDFLTVKGLYGRIRDIQEYTNNTVAGADLSLSISRAAKWDNFDWTIEGSVLDKYEPVTSGTMDAHTTGYSARMNLGYAGFRLSGEYMNRKAGPGFYNGLDTTRSEAIQVDFSYTGNGFGGLLTFRKLNNPMLQGIRERGASDIWTLINYVPALTQQHTYALAILNPYTAQNDEIGGQADLYYNFRRGTAMGGKKGMKVHANFSTYYGGLIDMATGVRGADQLLFRDLTVDIERWFGSDFKMILFYTWQTLNPQAISKGTGDELWRSHTVVADMTYKFDRKNSLRLELQHLYTKEDHKNWAAILLEYSFAPRWSVSVQDMWNYGDTKTHYINGSVSYSYSKVRAALNFGRFKEGYQCSGGVCRVIPAYTGVNISLIVAL